MNKQMRTSLIVLALIVIAGVAGGAYLQFKNKGGEVAMEQGQVAGEMDDSASIAPGTATTGDVKLNESARIAGVRITPTSVVEDSRCAEGVQCIQAGTVRILAKVIARGDADSAVQDYMFEVGVPMTVGTDQVTLVAVKPAPQAGAEIAPGDYVFTFTVVKEGGSEYYKG